MTRPAPSVGTTRRLALSAASLALGLLVSWAGATAWACLPLQSFVSIKPSSSGAPGTQVTVAGAGFLNAKVELRWNGVDGAVLATASGPSFSTTITIPTAPEGLYVVTALTRAVDGVVDGAGSSPYFVTGVSLPLPAGRAATAPPSKAADGTGASAAWAAGAGLVGALVGVGAGVSLSRRRRDTTHTPTPAEGLSPNGRDGERGMG